MDAGAPDTFGRALLEAHNRYRSRHGSPKLKWSSEAAKRAQSWAEHLARTGTLSHGDNEGLGQNIAYKSGVNCKERHPTDPCMCKGNDCSAAYDS